MDRIDKAFPNTSCRSDLEKMFSGMPAVFTGMLQGEELSQAYASSDIFVMPSELETLGLVVLEAVSSGVPVVAARAGGIPDIILEEQEGKTSFLFTPGDLVMSGIERGDGKGCEAGDGEVRLESSHEEDTKRAVQRSDLVLEEEESAVVEAFSVVSKDDPSGTGSNKPTAGSRNRM